MPLPLNSALRCASTAILMLIWVFSCYALPKDNEQAIQILADSSLINYKTGVNIYEGNVAINQGSTHLLADRVVTKNNTQHKMAEATAYGIKKLAEYSTLPKENDPVLTAKAKIIRYYPPKATVILEDHVIVTQGENSFHGALIVYNIQDQTVTAPANNNGRAVIIIEPKQVKT